MYFGSKISSVQTLRMSRVGLKAGIYFFSDLGVFPLCVSFFYTRMKVGDEALHFFLLFMVKCCDGFSHFFFIFVRQLYFNVFCVVLSFLVVFACVPKHECLCMKQSSLQTLLFFAFAARSKITCHPFVLFLWSPSSSFYTC